MTDLITVDTDICTDCRATLVALQNAYIALISGGKRLKVRFQDRWTEYHPGNARALLSLVQAVHAQCPDAEGLPDFSPSKRVKRGPPAYLRIT